MPLRKWQKVQEVPRRIVAPRVVRDPELSNQRLMSYIIGSLPEPRIRRSQPLLILCGRPFDVIDDHHLDVKLA